MLMGGGNSADSDNPLLNAALNAMVGMRKPRKSAAENASRKGFTPLIVAILDESPLQPALAEAAGAASVLNAVDKKGRSALFHAFNRGRLDAIAALLAAGADVGVTDRTGWGLLHLCAGPNPGNFAALQMLANHVQARDGERCLEVLGAMVRQVATQPPATPLSLACRAKRLGVQAALLALGADPNQQPGPSAAPLLSLAVARDDHALATLLLTRNADVNAPDTDGDTPLHYAKMACSRSMMQLLLAHGADPNLANKAGKRPLDCKGGNRKIGKKLRVKRFETELAVVEAARGATASPFAPSLVPSPAATAAVAATAEATGMAEVD